MLTEEGRLLIKDRYFCFCHCYCTKCPKFQSQILLELILMLYSAAHSVMEQRNTKASPPRDGLSGFGICISPYWSSEKILLSYHSSVDVRCS